MVPPANLPVADKLWLHASMYAHELRTRPEKLRRGYILRRKSLLKVTKLPDVLRLSDLRFLLQYIEFRKNL